MFGSVEKRGTSFRLRVTVGYNEIGNPIRKSKIAKSTNKNDAKKELALFIAELEADDYTETTNVTFSAFSQDFLKQHVNKNLSPTTQALYSSLLDLYILPQLGGSKLIKIKTMHMLAFMDKLQEDGLSVYVIKNTMGVVRSLFTCAVKWRVLKKNPCDGVQVKKPQKKIQKVYDQEDLKKLFDALKKENLEWQLLISIAIMTGARQGEIAGLEWKHIDTKKRTILFEQTIVEQPGIGVTIKKELKNGKDKIVSYPESLKSLIARFKAQKFKDRDMTSDEIVWPEHSFIFSNRNGKPKRPDSIGHRWTAFVKRHELDHIRFHDLRHTSATLLIANGVHAKIIQERLGHADIGTTMNVYGHVFREADQTAAETFGGLLDATKRKS
ncbi:hypothetical protein BMT55_00105 [Listeria newyorkensis]|uniref:Site-specific integrase n=1 Tax=Listeria newyorkensis TaxID=1497681 RepID=A0ABX4XRT2_9LIST|nr:site-specific integrase [Listeria newyorkensis]PNP94793.1 hypothetical protein BMT55_00105 [Listeria newyorkensis]